MQISFCTVASCRTIMKQIRAMKGWLSSHTSLLRNPTQAGGCLLLSRSFNHADFAGSAYLQRPTTYAQPARRPTCDWPSHNSCISIKHIAWRIPLMRRKTKLKALHAASIFPCLHATHTIKEAFRKASTAYAPDTDPSLEHHALPIFLHFQECGKANVEVWNVGGRISGVFGQALR